jgi:fatty acid desaturase
MLTGDSSRASSRAWLGALRFGWGVISFALDATWQVVTVPPRMGVSQADGVDGMTQELLTPPQETKEEIQAGAAMVRQAYRLVSDLMQPVPWIYWADLLVSAALGWTALVIGARAETAAVSVLAFVIATLSLYRASLFIHELTHLKAGAVPGFLAGWNLAVGIPLLLPSFMYVGVHHLHHARSRYGTAEDPEYLPLAHRSPIRIVGFLFAAGLLPVLLVGRFLVVTPLSVLSRRLRRLTVTRLSSLAINPAFRRRMPTGQDLVSWRRLEAASFLWAVTLGVLVWRGSLTFHALGFGVAVASAVALVNQVRTAAAHLFENEGGQMTIDQQLLDSVNVPGNPLITTLWAPVGLRFHALHHLLPGLPYHSLGAAHRRLLDQLPEDSPYRRTVSPSLFATLANLMRGRDGRETSAVELATRAG